MASGKTAVVERIFNSLWDDKSGGLRRSIITFDDVVVAINAVNVENPGRSRVSAANPANFFKDLTRRTTSANRHWPTSVFERGYTAVQLTGDGRCFEFVRTAEGQMLPFVGAVMQPSAEATVHFISTASLPLPVRALARSDEPSLLQISVRLRLIETHMALFSCRKDGIRQIDHLQNSVKLRLSEIDAIFLAIEEPAPGQLEQFLISCEAKSRGEDITAEQLRRQPEALLEAMPKYEKVVPLVVRSLGASRIHVVEFQEFKRCDLGASAPLVKKSEAIYVLIPPIPCFE
jgi:hypothetical protein